MRTYDVAVIGAGTAGLAAYRAARERTDSVALIEKGPFGTTCARIGCMPSKLMIAAARHAHAAANAPEFGVHPGKIEVNGPEVFARLRTLRDSFVASVLEEVEQLPQEDIIKGEAYFEAPGRLRVGSEVVEAERIVIATGSVPVVPDPIEEGTGGRYATIDQVWELKDLPRRAVVFGAGVIGVEIAQALAHLGVEVHCYSKGGKVGFLTDEEVSDEAVSILRRSMVLEPDATFGEMGWRGDVFTLEIEEERGTRRESFDYVLVATGRKPAIEGLNIGVSGVATDGDGVPVFDPVTRRCEGEEDLAVFIAGDADSGEMTIPAAKRSGDAAGANAGAWPSMPGPEPKTPLRIVFTEPNMASVGEPAAKLQDGADFVVGSASFADQGRARCENRNMGLLKVYAERPTGKILGAEMIAPDAEHLAHLLAWAMEADIQVGRLARFPIYHPVVEEGLMTALKDAAAKL